MAVVTRLLVEPRCASARRPSSHVNPTDPVMLSGKACPGECRLSYARGFGFSNSRPSLSVPRRSAGGTAVAASRESSGLRHGEPCAEGGSTMTPIRDHLVLAGAIVAFAVSVAGAQI